MSSRSNVVIDFCSCVSWRFLVFSRILPTDALGANGLIPSCNDVGCHHQFYLRRKKTDLELRCTSLTSQGAVYIHVSPDSYDTCRDYLMRAIVYFVIISIRILDLCPKTRFLRSQGAWPFTFHHQNQIGPSLSPSDTNVFTRVGETEDNPDENLTPPASDTTGTCRGIKVFGYTISLFVMTFNWKFKVQLYCSCLNISMTSC